ncbi:MAG: PCRF domain-containing protein, partial [Candidatus Eisenbacteria bacterium]
MQGELGDLEARLSAPGFWDQPNQAQGVVAMLKGTKQTVEEWAGLRARLSDLRDLAKLLSEDPDPGLEEELGRDLVAYKNELERYELRTYMDGAHDRAGAILTI